MYLNENPTEGPVRPEVREKVTGAISATFPPEFINRIDDIILYRSLSRSDIGRIVDANGKKIQLAVDAQACEWLAAAGYSPSYGARPMARLIQTEILNPLSKLLLQGRVRDGEQARVTADLRKNRLVVLPNHEQDVTMPGDSDDEDDDGMDLDVEELD